MGEKLKKKLKKKKKIDTSYGAQFGEAPKEEIRVIGKDRDYGPNDSWQVIQDKEEKKKPKKTKRNKRKAVSKLRDRGPEKAVDNPSMKRSEWKD